jgi:hypothetical protein
MAPRPPDALDGGPVPLAPPCPLNISRTLNPIAATAPRARPIPISATTDAFLAAVPAGAKMAFAA